MTVLLATRGVPQQRELGCALETSVAPAPQSDVYVFDEDDDVEHLRPMPSAGQAVALAGDAPSAVAPHEHRLSTATDSAERMGMLARHRLTRPWEHKPSRERRILQQLDALFATADAAVPALWAYAGEDALSWTSWPLLFTLGNVLGEAAAGVIEQHCDRVADVSTAWWAAQGLAASAYVGADELRQRLFAHAAPGAQAVAACLCAHQPETHDDLLSLFAYDDLRAACAARTLATLAPTAEASEHLVSLLETPFVADAAYTLTTWGDRRGLQRVVSDADLAVRLGATTFDLLALGGSKEHFEQMNAWMRRQIPTPAHLDAVARFGHAEAWLFLTHYLADEALDESAATALETLFGAAVVEDDRFDRGAWEDAIAARNLDPDVRYRRGEAWSVATVVAELTSGILSAEQMTGRAHEIRARSHQMIPLPRLTLWHGTAQRELASFAAEARQLEAHPWI